MTPPSNNKRKSQTIEIRCVAPSPTKDPIVCSFPSGVPESLRAPNNNTSSVRSAPPRFQWYDDHRLVGKDASCRYTAQGPPPQPKSGAKRKPSRISRTQLCVGVYDKQLQTLTLHPAAANGTVFALQQTVPSYLREAASSSSPNLSTAAAQYQALFADFGSAKKLKQIKSQQANRVDVDAVVGGAGMQLTDMSASNQKAMSERKAAAAAEQAAAATGQEASSSRISGNEIPSAVDAATKEWRKSFLPKFNENAEHPMDVYKPQDMAGSEAWKHASRFVQACWQNKDSFKDALLDPESAEGDTWKPSVKQLIDKIPDDVEQMETNQAKSIQLKLKCAYLLNTFLDLFLTHARKRFIPSLDPGRKSYSGRNVAVAERFLERFCTPTMAPDGRAGYAMSKANKDSCYVHLFLLYMMAASLTTGKNRTQPLSTDNIKPLAEELQMDTANAMHLLRQAGCTVKRHNKNKISAVLTTPLTFPRLKRAAAPKK